MIRLENHQNESKKKKLPINKLEDVEFSSELADQDDIEAQKRAQQADRRQEQQQ